MEDLRIGINNGKMQIIGFRGSCNLRQYTKYGIILWKNG